ncbi:GTP-binding protein [Thermotomaculum hydrothermale]|uniref:GTP-binding protein n=1 Tax=Thermotomaculum hydrothermale TaxID=981385 RepID=A0A7R6PZ42_9BACT|nr:radical SAM protein [Thermotomaculum hydrothermale]BBB33560.1 GTP-binding protein [Thermotomaculum hydrothermale]
MKYIFGPVPSRRFGRSLGIDLFPKQKYCTFNCVYCEVGTGTPKKDLIDFDYRVVLKELKEWLIKNHKALPDFITFAGSGEPTLYKSLGDLIKGIKEITHIPVVILTNGSLLFKKEIRENCKQCNYLVPSLDAGTEKTFLKINRPHREFSDYNRYVNGLIEMRKEFKGHYLLEVLLVEGINTTEEEFLHIKEKIDLIKPDKVQINTVFRPPAEGFAKSASEESINKLKNILGDIAEPVKYYSSNGSVIEHLKGELLKEVVLKTVGIRPCTIQELSDSLSINTSKLKSLVKKLEKDGLIEFFEYNGETHIKRIKD